jgi:signal transduction histidine kinase
VAHGFDDILRSVIADLDRVIDEVEADTPARQFASVALNRAICGSRMTHHLLAYAGNQMLHPECIEMAAFLADMHALLSRTLDPHITVALSVTQAPCAFADPGELQTALRNIAINGAQTMPGGGTLRIEAREEIANGTAWVSITVTDTGAGMDAATLARAVEPFLTTRGGAGAGLGLSMAHGFAAQSGGTLRIASTSGRGTTVELRLPATAAGAGAANEADRLVAVGDAGFHRRLRQYG